MGIILSLQGGMAAGKTTAARYAEEHMPGIYVSYENPAPVVEIIRARGLDSNTFEGFVEIQRLFIELALKRFAEFRNKPLILEDLGADEIEFYTLNYPKALGKKWDIEAALAPELAALRQSMAQATLFLDLSVDQLHRNKLSDTSRKRSSFEFSTEYLLTLKREWYIARSNTTFVKIDGLNKAEVGQLVLRWVRDIVNLA